MSTTPVIVDEKKPVVTEVPVSPNAETDKRVSEVLNDKKKKKHPVEARIAELTSKNKEIIEKAAADKKELEGKLAEQNEKNIAAELDRRKAEAAANDKRPNRDDFPGDANGTADFTAKMAEWVVRQQEKIQVKPAAVEGPKPDPVQDAARKQEFDGFLEAGKAFVVRYPDFNDVLQKAAERGLKMDNSAMLAIIRSKAPEVAYYLAKPENDAVARKFMTLDGMSQVMEIGKIAERLAVNPNDFVSSAGHVGPRLNGGARADIQPDNMDVDDYLRKRKQDIKAGVRRR